MYVETYMILMGFSIMLLKFLPVNGINGFHTETNEELRKKAEEQAKEDAETKINSFITKAKKFQDFAKSIKSDESESSLSKLNELIFELLQYSEKCFFKDSLKKIKEIQIFSKIKLEEIIAEIKNFEIRFSKKSLEAFKKELDDCPGSSILSSKVQVACFVDGKTVSEVLNN